MKPYSIYAPEYTQRSAGVRALYWLRDFLIGMGFDVEIGLARRFGDSITIYPEIVTHNPWAARRVARWALKATVQAEPEDQVWSWSVSFLDKLNQATRRSLSERDVLNLPLVETEIFNNLHPVYRRGAVFYRVDPLRGQKNWITEITGDWPDTRAEMADLLRRSEYLVCGHPSTLVDEARFCGCPVVVTGFDLPERSDYGMDGVCDRMENLDEARRTVADALPRYLAYHEQLPARLKHFAARTQEGW